MPELAADDIPGQALFAVYQKGMRFAKGKGNGKPASGNGGKGKGNGPASRCLNCGKEGH